MSVQGKQLEVAGASGLLSISVQPADPSTTQAAQRAKHMLSTSRVGFPSCCRPLTTHTESPLFPQMWAVPSSHGLTRFDMALRRKCGSEVSGG